MKVTVTLEVRFDVLPDGSVWTLSNFHRSFWNRYLEVYDSVEIVARANYVKEISSNARRVDENPFVTFRPIPFYIGPWDYLMKWKDIRATLKKIEQDAEAVILRVGSPIADILQPILEKKNHPFALEVVGDPYDTFAPGSLKSPLRPFYRWYFARKLRQQARSSSAASYVTSVRLPDRYPTSEKALRVFASSIELPPHHLSQGHRDYTKSEVVRLITVGALEDWRKGPDTALNAIRKLKEQDISFHYTWVGDGRIRHEVESLAEKLGLRSHMTFTGHLPSGEAVLNALDAADVMILPTRGEGLPRAVIEAMARGLVCVATDVGGIPELLSQEFMHAPGDHHRLAEILIGLINNKSVLNQESVKNRMKAENYLSDKIQQNRKKMYITLKGVTDEWKKNHSVR